MLLYQMGQHFKWSPGGDTFIHGSSASDFIGAVVGSDTV